MRLPGFIVTTALCLLWSCQAFAQSKDMPEQTIDGLYRVPETRLAVVYAKPDVDLSVYKRFFLIEPQVAFTRDWLRNQNSIPGRVVTPADVERIKSDLAKLFMQVFNEELRVNGGYALADAPAEDVLVIRPSILDLNVVSPETPRSRNSRSAIASAGGMTLYMELLDSVSGDMLVKALDFQFDSSHPRVMFRDSVRNERAARAILQVWAEIMRKGLDEARATVSK